MTDLIKILSVKFHENSTNGKQVVLCGQAEVRKYADYGSNSRYWQCFANASKSGMKLHRWKIKREPTSAECGT